MKKFATLFLVACVWLPFNFGLCQSQKNSGNPNGGTQSTSSDTSTNTTDSSGGKGGAGFAIEAEIVAYKSLESDGEAIACDVAGFVFEATSFSTSAQNELSGSKPKSKYKPIASTCTLTNPKLELKAQDISNCGYGICRFSTMAGFDGDDEAAGNAGKFHEVLFIPHRVRNR